MNVRVPARALSPVIASTWVVPACSSPTRISGPGFTASASAASACGSAGAAGAALAFRCARTVPTAVRARLIGEASVSSELVFLLEHPAISETRASAAAASR